jgi:WD40 repeat protein
VATGCADGTLRIWRYSATGVVPQRQPLQRINFGEPVRDIAWSSDGEWIAALLDSGKIRVCAVSSQDLHEVAAMESPGARRLGFFGSYQLVAWSAETCASWGVQTPCFAQRLVAGGEVQVGFHQDGALTASALEVVHGLQAPVLAWSGGFKVSGGQQASWMGDSLVYREGNAWKYTRASREQSPARLRLQVPPELLSESGSFAVSPNGVHAALRASGHLRCLDAQWKEIGTAAKPAVKPALIAASDAGPVTARLEGDFVIIRDHHSGRETPASVRGVLGLTFIGGGGRLACRTYTGVTFVEAESGATTEAAVAAPSATRLPIASSADGRWLAVGGAGHEVIIGRMPAGGAAQDGADKTALQNVFVDPVVLTIPSPKRITSLAWHKTGDRLACGTSDGFVQLWNLSLLRQTLRLWKLDWSDAAPRAAPESLPVTLN